MSVSNLTNTKWIFNSTVDTTNYGDFNIIFNSGSMQNVGMTYGSGDTVSYNTLGNDYVAYSNNAWLDEDYRIIEITGGTDVTNSDLIAWLEENATLQPNAKTFDLSALQLSAGTHTIQVKARATGYRDSEFSNSVSYINLPIVIDEDIVLRNYADGLMLVFNVNGFNSKYGVNLQDVQQDWDRVDWFRNNENLGLHRFYIQSGDGSFLPAGDYFARIILNPNESSLYPNGVIIQTATTTIDFPLE